MTHKKLLAKINQGIESSNYSNSLGEWHADNFLSALREVVELHSHILYKNTETDEMYDQCHECSGNGYHALYPCNTIRAIEKELG